MSRSPRSVFIDLFTGHGHRHPDEGPSLKSPMKNPPVIIMTVSLYVAMRLPHSKQGLTLLLKNVSSGTRSHQESEGFANAL